MLPVLFTYFIPQGSILAAQEKAATGIGVAAAWQATPEVVRLL